MNRAQLPKLPIGIQTFSNIREGGYLYVDKTAYFTDIIHGSVVILIDEYDKPIPDALDDVEKAREFRAVLRGFYTQIKGADEHIRFVFITGITKFAKTGVFSALNNLYDISLDERFADAALAQIRAKGYADKYTPAATTLVGIAIETSARQIGAWRVEEMGR